MLLKNLRGTDVGVIVWNMFSQIVGKLFGAGSTFLVTLLIARTYGAEGYGDFTKITTYIAFFYAFADFGLNAVYLQQARENKNAERDGWAGLLGLRILGSLFLIFAALAILAFIPQGRDQGYTSLVRLGIILFSPAIIFQTLLTSANAIFQKSLRYDFSSIAVGIGSATTLVLLWFIIGSGVGASGILLSVGSLLVGSLVTALIALWYAKKIVGEVVISFKSRQMLAILLPAAPLGLAILFNLIYFHVDSLILALTRSTSEVGIYGLAYKVFEALLVFPVFFMNVVYPLMLKTTVGDLIASRDKFQNLLHRSLILLLVISCVLTVIMWIGAPLLVLVRSDFAASIAVLRILSLGLPLFFVSALFFWALIALEKQKALVAVYGISMVLNIVLNLIFIPRYGYIAAAWITIVSEGFVLLLLTPLLRRFLVFKLNAN